MEGEREGGRDELRKREGEREGWRERKKKGRWKSC